MIGEQPHQIIDVWASNVDEEFEKIQKLLPLYPIVAMDTEFPGEVYRPMPSGGRNLNYEKLKKNVNQLKLIQLGLTLGNERGELPEGASTWQFNFKFNPTEDRGAENSISMLIKAGINFDQFAKDGIDVHYFAQMLTTSGLVLNDGITWLTFHSSSDYGYLVKLLTNVPLPSSEEKFLKTLRLFFPRCYDLKLVAQTRRSLSFLGSELGVVRVGQMHQAGSDSLLTYSTYIRVVNLFYQGKIEVEGMNGKIGGLTDDDVVFYDSLLSFYVARKKFEFEEKMERRKKRRERNEKRRKVLSEVEDTSREEKAKTKEESDSDREREITGKSGFADWRRKISERDNSADNARSSSESFYDDERDTSDDESTDVHFDDMEAKEEFYMKVGGVLPNEMSLFGMSPSSVGINQQIGRYDIMGLSDETGGAAYDSLIMSGMMVGQDPSLSSHSPTQMPQGYASQGFTDGASAQLQNMIMCQMASFSPSPTPLTQMQTQNVSPYSHSGISPPPQQNYLPPMSYQHSGYPSSYTHSLSPSSYASSVSPSSSSSMIPMRSSPDYPPSMTTPQSSISSQGISMQQVRTDQTHHPSIHQMSNSLSQTKIHSMSSLTAHAHSFIPSYDYTHRAPISTSPLPTSVSPPKLMTNQFSEIQMHMPVSVPVPGYL
ncbi:putative CCR4-NOT transcription complex, subunit 7 [Monocercomonoides exilis]|uniref:putative CCR4-NOT transcription complex, subunit 7 n=1 Tax=Monocercomonoides exilis TaxID=2049356 RepID=UPI0035593E75|nr:putative CCR4-NOT transcription complex, subunit 7 [Monocercomonoides exilis]|eukprot:MONOS_3599.1-p1 / transcript=MONOS_3599.1 / gene=MONOS_3599 / organism=Monocercomonoides_exilis_PA203 / gene_product=CCR4-NOT transcription complex, subunit 7, isoform CRA_a / transcript_product=CCR4-NOT transcription complex, subunit 7, isoform CRA_a / location=Mono_scaffold00086:36026-38081(-) / protein_length=656 / sequence_SO=supercontig / SO=protein_coding / is_pseudo=false